MITKEKVAEAITKADEIMMDETACKHKKWAMSNFNSLYNKVLKMINVDRNEDYGTVLETAGGTEVRSPISKAVRTALVEHMEWQGHNFRFSTLSRLFRF